MILKVARENITKKQSKVVRTTLAGLSRYIIKSFNNYGTGIKDRKVGQQNRTDSRNRPRHMWSIEFSQRRENYSIQKG